MKAVWLSVLTLTACGRVGYGELALDPDAGSGGTVDNASDAAASAVDSQVGMTGGMDGAVTGGVSGTGGGLGGVTGGSSGVGGMQIGGMAGSVGGSVGMGGAVTGGVSGTGGTVPSILGHWVQAPGALDFGDMYIAEIAGQIRAVYTFRNGRIVGDLTDDTLDCWWSETPNRKEPNQAGACTFVFSESMGVGHAIGSWSEGGNLRTGWDLDYSDPTIPPAIMTIFLNDAEFVDGR